MQLTQEERREFGRYLATLRDRQALTQQEAADKIGISRVQVARWESGSSLPEWEVLDSIAQAYLADVHEMRLRRGQKEANENLSNWALSLARRIDRRAAKLKPVQKQALERTIDSLFSLSETA